MSASYGGSAALVVNKQETDRERRLRLRREEFAKRSGQDRQEHEGGWHEGSRGGSAHDEPVHMGPMRADEDIAGNGAQRAQQEAGLLGVNEPQSREAIWEAKRRRYIELCVPAPHWF
jgi:hypothetical protein